MNVNGVFVRPRQTKWPSRLAKALAPRLYEQRLDLQARAVRRLSEVAIATQGGTSPRDLRLAMLARERACEATAACLCDYRHDLTQAVRRLFVDVAEQPRNSVAVGVVLGITRAGAELAFVARGGKHREADIRRSCYTAILEAVKPLADASCGYIYALEKAPANQHGLSWAENWFYIWMLDRQMWEDRARHARDLAILGVVTGLQEHLPAEHDTTSVKRRFPCGRLAASREDIVRSENLKRFRQMPSLRFFDPARPSMSPIDGDALIRTSQAMVDYMQICSDAQLMALLKTMPAAREPPAFDVRITHLGTLLNGAARRWGAPAPGVPPAGRDLQPKFLVPILQAVATGPVERRVVDVLLYELATGVRAGDTAEKIMRRMAAVAAELSYRWPTTRMTRFEVEVAAQGLQCGKGVGFEAHRQQKERVPSSIR